MTPKRDQEGSDSRSVTSSKKWGERKKKEKELDEDRARPSTIQNSLPS